MRRTTGIATGSLPVAFLVENEWQSFAPGQTNGQIKKLVKSIPWNVFKERTARVGSDPARHSSA
jgi:hypothetical protein